MREYMTPKEVAERLKVDRITVYRMVKDGRLPVVRIGRGLRIPASAVAAMLEPAKP
ncbi:MAG: helix-turn-helix domain-containing protein [Thermoleophilia bacterium]|nr:helix-turn-helix domain-containing protein [Thermoleophilia bacterium]